MIQSLTPIKISSQGSLEEILITGLKKIVEINDKVTSVFFQIVPIEIVETKNTNGFIKIESKNALGLLEYCLKINGEKFSLDESIGKIVRFLKTKVKSFEKVFFNPINDFEKVRIVTFNCRAMIFENEQMIDSTISTCYKAVWTDPLEAEIIEAVTLKEGCEFRNSIRSLDNLNIIQLTSNMRTSFIKTSVRMPLEALLRSCIKSLTQDVNTSITSLFLEIIPVEVLESKKNLKMSYQVRPLGRYRYTFKPQKYKYDFHLKSLEIVNFLRNKTNGIEKKWIIKEPSLETVRIVTFYIRIKKFSGSRSLSCLSYISYKSGFGFSEENNFLEYITIKKADEFLKISKNP